MKKIEYIFYNTWFEYMFYNTWLPALDIEIH